MVIQQICYIASKHSTRISVLFLSFSTWIWVEKLPAHKFFLSSSEIQVSEESLSQVNSALKQVTIELETARGEVLALNDTKDLVTKELNDLQQTLTGKLVLRKQSIVWKQREKDRLFCINYAIDIENVIFFQICCQKKGLHSLKPTKNLKMQPKNLKQRKRYESKTSLQSFPCTLIEATC